MGVRNYLIEGVSGTGKTSVCAELQRRGYHAIHGDRDLAYQGDPKTGEPLEGFAHEHHIWDVDKVSALVADHRHAASFFCGGSRNFDLRVVPQPHERNPAYAARLQRALSTLGFPEEYVASVS